MPANKLDTTLGFCIFSHIVALATADNSAEQILSLQFPKGKYLLKVPSGKEVRDRGCFGDQEPRSARMARPRNGTRTVVGIL
ncbi:hypothetical protein BDY21DRAFT_147021 [Lineolata rhizophorae]|uniref:Uncharacterized protein n=1 Tax=Lineolata rhizophorae TaxID=578093 RepID=A0A6A6NMY5_9PEZI|nr:hypothetical protein BDY21DRAFT_147021 [Lineolata rhizophorae]